MNYEIHFESNYKGKILDIVKMRVTSALWDIFISILTIFIGVYVAFWDTSREIESPQLVGYILIIFGVILFCPSPFLLFQKAFNRHMKGKVTIVFSHENESKVWNYRLSCSSSFYCDEGEISLIETKKNLASITSVNGKTIYIPLKELNENERNFVVSYAKEIRDYREEQTKKEKLKE